jgi:hypothetical protein
MVYLEEARKIYGREQGHACFSALCAAVCDEVSASIVFVFLIYISLC